MADWIKCTPRAQGDKAVYVNMDRVFAVLTDGSGSIITFGVANGIDSGRLAVLEPPESLLGGNKIRRA